MSSKEVSEAELGGKKINTQQSKWQFCIKMDEEKSIGYQKLCLCAEECGKVIHKHSAQICVASIKIPVLIELLVRQISGLTC